MGLCLEWMLMLLMRIRLGMASCIYCVSTSVEELVDVGGLTEKVYHVFPAYAVPHHRYLPKLI